MAVMGSMTLILCAGGTAMMGSMTLILCRGDGHDGQHDPHSVQLLPPPCPPPFRTPVQPLSPRPPPVQPLPPPTHTLLQLLPPPLPLYLCSSCSARSFMSRMAMSKSCSSSGGRQRLRAGQAGRQHTGQKQETSEGVWGGGSSRGAGM